MDHMLDTVLRSLKDAPEGTFRRQRGPNPFKQGTAYIQEKVNEYLSGHTLTSITEPAPPPSDAEYEFPEDLENLCLVLNTSGCGHFYKALRSATSAQKNEWSSKRLEGEHDCTEHFFEMRPVLNTMYDDLLGTVRLKITPDVHLCSRSTGTVRPEHRQSFFEHMNAFLNSDDPELVRELKTMQRVLHGEAGPELTRLARKAANEWLKASNLTCHDFTYQTGKSFWEIAPEVHSRHLQSTPLTADAIAEASELALNDFEKKKDIPPKLQQTIRSAVTAAIASIENSKPEGTTFAQWSEALTLATRCLAGQMWDETIYPGLPEGYNDTEDTEHQLHWKAKVDVVAQGPEDPRDIEAHMSYFYPSNQYTTTGYIKVCGELRDQQGASDRYPRSEEQNTLWVPIAGPPASDEAQSVQSTDIGELPDTTHDDNMVNEPRGEEGPSTTATAGATGRTRHHRLRKHLKSLRDYLC